MTTDELIRDYTNARSNVANGYGPARTAAYRAEAHRLERVLAERVEHLERRLTDGEARIAEAEAQGHDTRKWEDFWLGLLAEYERTYDAINGETA